MAKTVTYTFNLENTPIKAVIPEDVKDKRAWVKANKERLLQLSKLKSSPEVLNVNAITPNQRREIDHIMKIDRQHPDVYRKTARRPSVAQKTVKLAPETLMKHFPQYRKFGEQGITDAIMNEYKELGFGAEELYRRGPHALYASDEAKEEWLNEQKEEYKKLTMLDQLTKPSTKGKALLTELFGTGGVGAATRLIAKPFAKQAVKKGGVLKSKGSFMRGISDAAEHSRSTAMGLGGTSAGIGAISGALSKQDPNVPIEDWIAELGKRALTGAGIGAGLSLGLKAPSYAVQIANAKDARDDLYGQFTETSPRFDKAIMARDPEAYKLREESLARNDLISTIARGSKENWKKDINSNVSAIREQLAGGPDAPTPIEILQGLVGQKPLPEKRTNTTVGFGLSEPMREAREKAKAALDAANAKYDVLKTMDDEPLDAVDFKASVDALKEKWDKKIVADYPEINKVFKQLDKKVAKALKKDKDGNLVGSGEIGVKDMMSLDQSINDALRSVPDKDMGTHRALSDMKKDLDGVVEGTLEREGMRADILKAKDPDSFGDFEGLSTTPKENLYDAYKDARKSYRQYFDTYVDDYYVDRFTRGHQVDKDGNLKHKPTSPQLFSDRVFGTLLQEEDKVDKIAEGFDKIINIVPSARGPLARDQFNAVTRSTEGDKILDRTKFLGKGGEIYLSQKNKPILDVLHKNNPKELNTIKELYEQVNSSKYKPSDDNYMAKSQPSMVGQFLFGTGPRGRKPNKETRREYVSKLAQTKLDTMGDFRNPYSFNLGAGMVAEDVPPAVGEATDAVADYGNQLLYNWIMGIK